MSAGFYFLCMEFVFFGKYHKFFQIGVVPGFYVAVLCFRISIHADSSSFFFFNMCVESDWLERLYGK